MTTPEDDLAGLASGRVDAGSLSRLARGLSSSARAAGGRAVASGRWLADVALDVAPRIPVRDRATLEQQHDGLTGPALAGELIKAASRHSATVGAAAGVLAGVEELAPPAWLAIPLELMVETLAVAAIEMKLVAELHEAYGQPVPGDTGDRAMAVVRAWAERRGVTPLMVADPSGLADSLGRSARHEVVRLVRRRLLRRLGYNLSSLAPMLAGAAAGAEVNRRATLALGQAVLGDLAAR